MLTAGSDWRDNPVTQIRWDLSYINSRYQTLRKADADQRRLGWY